jgi:rhodanese-related sulfurtransferase
MTDVKVIDVTEYNIYADTDHILVDVREVDEYEEGHLPGAVNIPLSQFTDRYTEIPQDKAVLLVCKLGGRSMQAAQFMATQDKGYPELVNLDGGTMDWIAAGNPVEK